VNPAAVREPVNSFPIVTLAVPGSDVGIAVPATEEEDETGVT
jgi:hypothetical protein